jgi:hypothetical protein
VSTLYDEAQGPLPVWAPTLDHVRARSPRRLELHNDLAVGPLVGAALADVSADIEANVGGAVPTQWHAYARRQAYACHCVGVAARLERALFPEQDDDGLAARLEAEYSARLVRLRRLAAPSGSGPLFSFPPPSAWPL